jgi:hypothetical protein
MRPIRLRGGSAFGIEADKSDGSPWRPLLTDAVDKIGGATGLVAPGCEAELVLCLYPHLAGSAGSGTDATGRHWHRLSRN